MDNMMGDSFQSTGHPADLRSNAYLSVGALVDALDQMRGSWDQFTTVRVLDPLSTDPVISVERDERVTRVDMSAIMDGFISPRTGTTTIENSGQLKDALKLWTDTLPVSDREAGAGGIRVLDWADPTCESLTVDVVVRRGKRLTSWTPSTAITRYTDNLVRVTATVNALAEVNHVDCTPDGTAVIWRHPDPRLSSVIFADRDLATRWGIDPHLVCVYTPGFPVVAAPLIAASRMAEETMVDHHLLSFARAAQLAWKKP